MLNYALLFFFITHAVGPLQAPEFPEDSGAYYSQGDSRWVQLQPAVTSSADASGVQMFVETGGYTDLAMSVTLPGGQARLRISVQKPEFFVRAVGSATDAMLVQLQKKKDTRTYKTTFSNVTVKNKGGFQKGHIFRLITETYPDGSFSASPEKSLPPGEYILVLGNNIPAYDFGVDEEK
jgi:hypothetical protein